MRTGTHKMFEIRLSKNGGNTWYHYLWIVGYFENHITDESIIEKITRQHEFLVNDKTQMKVIRDS